MKKLRSCLLVLFALFLALAPLSGCKRNQDDDPPSEGFVPVVRFAVASDLHTRDDSADPDQFASRDMVTAYMQSAYKYSEAQSDYNKLDGIFFVGDITQGGADDEFSDFFSIVNQYTKTGTISRAVLGNHEFYATKYNDGTNSDIRYSDTSVKNTNERFKQYGGYEAVDAHLEIGGYHFIFLSMDRYDKSLDNFFTDAKLKWLEAEIKKAVQADESGKKPIFVFQHEPPKDTMYGSVHTAADEDLTKVLAKYPQVVDFSGHTHYPITDPRAIWQDTFTALTTGGMAYLGIPIAGHPERDESLVVASNATGSWVDTDEGFEHLDLESYIRNATMYYIVEVSATHTVRITVVDSMTNEAWGEPKVFTVGDPDEFVYTDARSKKSVAPTWPTGAALSIVGNTYGRVKLAIPQATCDDVVQNYRVQVYTSMGTPIGEPQYVLACTYYGKNTPNILYANLTDLLPNTEYSCTVTPVNSWGKEGKALSIRFTTSKSLADTATPTPDILQTVFNSDGTATNAVTGEALTKWGDPTVSTDANLNKKVASFDGVDDAFGMFGLGDWYDAMGKSYTIEAYIYVANRPTSGYVNHFSNQQSGGFGFEYKSDGKMYFYANSGETSKPSAAIAPGAWYHIVGTYDGANVKLYINGQLKSTVAATGVLKRPHRGNCEHIVIGGDTTMGAASCFANCKVATANLYSDALSAGQVQSLYNAYN